jgi:hypothetical protein
LIFLCFIEEKRGCVTEREMREGKLFEANGIRYRNILITSFSMTSLFSIWNKNEYEYKLKEIANT